jgi:RNA polymerase sigma factor (sigma-70 family)
MPDDRYAHRVSLTDRGQTTLDTPVTTIPPFESFYAEHRGIVLGVLRKRLGTQRADDAFQETFLRALAAYGRLRDAENLRGWVLIIAERVAIDTHRRARPTEELPEVPHEDGRPAYEDLGELTDGLPPTERAAVVLRYGYDLTYDQIAAALGSNATAARQATSSGVRRLRRKGEL